MTPVKKVRQAEHGGTGRVVGRAHRESSSSLSRYSSTLISPRAYRNRSASRLTTTSASPSVRGSSSCGPGDPAARRGASQVGRGRPRTGPGRARTARWRDCGHRPAALPDRPARPGTAGLPGADANADLRGGHRRARGTGRGAGGLVFQRFWQGPDAAGTTGSGIGLVVVSELVQAHGGAVTVDSTPGAGTTFTVCLPRAARARSAVLA